MLVDWCGEDDEKGLITENNPAKGNIVIGDIAFATSTERELAHKKWKTLWDEGEYYWAEDEIVDACKRIGLQVKYKQVSSCGGVFVFDHINLG